MKKARQQEKKAKSHKRRAKTSKNDPTTVATKVPFKLKEEFEKLAKTEKKTVSTLLKKMIEGRIHNFLSFEEMVCDSCDKPIWAKEKYFAITHNLERYENTPSDPEIEIIDSGLKHIYCLKCAEKKKMRI